MREPIDLVWAGGEHPFLLRIGEMIALEASCKSGVSEIFGRLVSSLGGTGGMAGRWSSADVTETLRLGLIGGGMERNTARDLVNGAVERQGLLGLAGTASHVLFSSLSPAGEPEEASEDATEKKP